jgi:lipoprotein-releasing system ATP-binding protein
MDDIIVVKGLTKSFGDVVVTKVLHNIDISFKKGAFTAIIGPSGSGKTSLLNIISLLEFPTSGYLEVTGHDFSEGRINKYAKFRNENIGFIFQFHYLLPEFNALENILIPYWIGSGKPDEGTKKRALDIMNKIGIENIKDKYPNQISGGQQQRIAIARALIKNPKIIFADEPTGNLDRESGDSVLEVMKNMVSESGTTLIMVTHDREIAMKADRIVELVDGKICKSLVTSELGKDKVKELLEDSSCNIE